MAMTAASPETASPDQENGLVWTLWVMMAAFGSYFCMYGFRKPFTAARFDDTVVLGMGFKTVLVTSQVAGYMLSKFLGIKIIAELPPQKRAVTILGLILSAEVALILFGVLPRPWNAVCLFFNGLPLGMTFGLILGFLEGRRQTELLAAGLCTSFILADGVTKTVGKWLLLNGVPEDWMPSIAGGLFLTPLFVFVAMLTRISPPSSRDIAARSERSTMSRDVRRSFLSRHAYGLVPLLLLYLSVTIVRSIRADFAPEIWQGLGRSIAPGTFTSTETLVALGVLALNGGAILIRNNRHAFFAALATCGLGVVLLTAALLAYSDHRIGGYSFMVLLGLGLYLPYVAMHTTVFERLLGMTREQGNVGFLMYLADSVGYLGYVIVMIARNFLPVMFDILTLLTITCWATVGLSCLCLLASWRYFARLKSPQAARAQETATAGMIS